METKIYLLIIRNFKFLLLTALLIFITKNKINAQSIGINTTTALPDPSAMLDIASTDKGLLIPRVSLNDTIDTVTIAHPAISLLVYNTNNSMTGGNEGFWHWNGSKWQQTTLPGGTTGAVPYYNGSKWVTNSTNFYDNGGNIGIGTSSPASLLSVGSSSQFQVNSSGNITKLNGTTTSFPTSNASGVLTNNGSGTLSWAPTSSSAWSLAGNSGTTAGTNFIGTTDAVDWVVKTNNTERMRVLSGGNVGIGTGYAANNKLVLVSSSGKIKMAIGNSYFISATAPTSIDSATYLHLGMGESNVGSYRLIGFGYNNGGAALPAAWMGYQQMTTNGSQFGDLIFGTRSVTTNTTASERMRIKYNGNIGMGTSSPTFPLTRVGLSVRASTSDGAEIILQSTSATDGTSYGLVMLANSTNGYLYNRLAGNLYLGTNNNSTQVTVLPSGNVGIGTTTPASKLDVEGGVAIGASYSGTTAAPTNGAIIQGNVGIGTSAPSSSAILELSSTTGGFIVPRMTTTQKNALTAVNGMIVYDTTLNKFSFYQNGSWVQPF